MTLLELLKKQQIEQREIVNYLFEKEFGDVYEKYHKLINNILFVTQSCNVRLNKAIRDDERKRIKNKTKVK